MRTRRAEGDFALGGTPGQANSAGEQGQLDGCRERFFGVPAAHFLYIQEMTEPKPYYRPIRSTFQPRFTLSLFYLVGFFFLFAMVIVVPDLLDAYRQLPPGTEEEQLAVAREVASEAIQPRLWLAIAASVFATALGLYFNVLPGLRKPRP